MYRVYGKYFNPLPRKEGDDALHQLVYGMTDFNPLPRKEGDENETITLHRLDISIHSLVKRETYEEFVEKFKPKFQSTPS